MGGLTVRVAARRPNLAAGILAAGFLALAGGAAEAQSPGEGDDALRQRALELVNQSRGQNDLPPLQLTDELTEAASVHAEDMAERNFYAHVSPDGSTVRDRYLDAGGSRWKLVAENIARCEGCPTPPDADRVESFHEGWMNSPGHRANILSEGLEGFGFALVSDEETTYGVQTFSGPGTPDGMERDEQQVALSAGELSAGAVERINRARDRRGTQPLSGSSALDRVAAGLIAGGEGDRLIDRSADLFELLPEDQRTSWSSLNVVAAGCGGCGSSPVAADVRRFVRQWTDNPRYETTLLGDDADGLGFALEADGQGRKVAVAVVGTRR